MKILIISDIHFGKKDPKITYEMLKKDFIVYMKKAIPNLIVVAGDLYDKRFGIHSDVSEYVNKFISELVEFCNDNDSDLFLIRGTLSHDDYQLKSFNHYLTNKHIKIFDKVEEINYKGLDILIMPEEYVPFSYYNKYLEKKHDLIFGHGMFDFATVVTSKDLKRKHQEVLNSKKISDNVRFGAYFGHVHKAQNHQKVNYVGSYDRLDFGDGPDSKSFLELNIEGCKFSEKSIINKYAQTYKTINHKDIPSDMEICLNYLRKLSNENDYIRIIIDSEIDEPKFNNITGFSKNSDNVTILKKIVGLTNQSNNIKHNEELEKQRVELNNKIKSFEGLSFIEITRKIAMDEYGVDLTADEILEVIEK